MAVWRLLVPSSRPYARLIRYSFSCYAHNHRVGEVSSDCTSLKDTIITATYQDYNNGNMACLLCYCVPPERPHIEGTRVSWNEHVLAALAIRVVSPNIWGVSSYCFHCCSSVHTDNGLFQDFKNAANKADPIMCPTGEQNVISRHTVPQAPAPDQDLSYPCVRLSSLLYSARGDDVDPRIWQGFEHDCLHVRPSCDANFILLETCYESYNSVCHKLWVPPVELPSYYLSLINSASVCISKRLLTSRRWACAFIDRDWKHNDTLSAKCYYTFSLFYCSYVDKNLENFSFSTTNVMRLLLKFSEF